MDYFVETALGGFVVRAAAKAGRAGKVMGRTYTSRAAAESLAELLRAAEKKTAADEAAGLSVGGEPKSDALPL
jgi:hypothetical protein